MFIEDFRRLIVPCAGAAILLAGPLAHAFELPPALDKQSLVCKMTESPAMRSAAGEDGGDGTASHGHRSLARWNLREKKSKLQVERKILGERLHYLDKAGSWFNEIQRPGFYVVNSHADPVTADSAFGEQCQPKQKNPPIFATDDFVFAFAIHAIENDDGMRTPHMLIYLPIRTNPGIATKQAQEFKLLLHHIEKRAEDCAADDHEARCKALVHLQSIWADDTYTPHELVDAARRLIKDILGLTAVDEADRKKRTTAGLAVGDAQIDDHNGVIHGTLKN